MRKKKIESRRPLQPVLFVLLFPIVFIVYLVWFSGEGMGEIRKVYADTRSAMIVNNYEYQDILTYVFNKAKNCNNSPVCQKQISDEIHKNLKANNQTLPFYESTYFVRVNENGNLEKLFLHGEWKEELVDREGERKVASHLKNNKTGNIGGLRLNTFFSTMIYLNDFNSEAEIIVPFVKEGKTLGAVVKLYGD